MLNHHRAVRGQVRRCHTQRRLQAVIIIRGVQKDKVAVRIASRSQEVAADDLTLRLDATVRDVCLGDGPCAAIFFEERDVRGTATDGFEPHRASPGKRVQHARTLDAGAKHIEQRLPQPVRRRPHIVCRGTLQTAPFEQAGDDPHGYPTATRPKRCAQLAVR